MSICQTTFVNRNRVARSAPLHGAEGQSARDLHSCGPVLGSSRRSVTPTSRIGNSFRRLSRCSTLRARRISVFTHWLFMLSRFGETSLPGDPSRITPRAGVSKSRVGQASNASAGPPLCNLRHGGPARLVSRWSHPTILTPRHSPPASTLPLILQPISPDAASAARWARG